MPKTIDPLATAQLLEGVARSLRFLAEMPEGFIESHLAPGMTFASALEAAPKRPLALPPASRRTDAEPPTGTPKTRAVKMRLDGKLPFEIAEATGLSVHQVYGAISEARGAGVKFPKTPRAKKGKGGRTQSFALTLDQVSEKAMPMVGRAASERGISLQAYMDRRKLAVEMALAGRHVRAIMETTKESKGTLSGWFNGARAAGYPVPYMIDARPTDFEPVNVRPPTTKPADVIDFTPRRKPDDDHRGRFITSMDELDGHGSGGITKGAALMDVTVEEFLRRRREVLTLFERGATIPYAAKVVGITHKQAANWRGRAQRAGKLNLTPVGAARAATREQA